jgi:hypothetical protein
MRCRLASFEFVEDPDQRVKALRTAKGPDKLVDSLLLGLLLNGSDEPGVEGIAPNPRCTICDSGQEVSVEVLANSLDAEVIPPGNLARRRYPASSNFDAQKSPPKATSALVSVKTRQRQLTVRVRQKRQEKWVSIWTRHEWHLGSKDRLN